MYNHFYEYEEYFINDQNEKITTMKKTSEDYNTLGECFEDSFDQEILKKYGDQIINIEKLENINLQKIDSNKAKYYNHIYSYTKNEKKIYFSFNYYQAKKRQTL